jgi:hypothetical protein
MANTITRLGYQQLGNRFLTISLITGDGATTTITAKSIQLSRIECAWLADVSDGAELTLTTYAGSSVELSAAIASGAQMLFAIGF